MQKPFNKEKVKRIKKQIESGKYKPDVNSATQKIINNLKEKFKNE